MSSFDNRCRSHRDPPATTVTTIGPNKVYCGRYYPVSCDLVTSISELEADGFEFLVTPVFHPRFRRELIDESERPASFTRSMEKEEFSDIARYVSGALSSGHAWDCEDALVRKHSWATLRQELSFVSYIGVNVAWIKIYDGNIVNLANALSSILATKDFFTDDAPEIWIQVPIYRSKTAGSEFRLDINPNPDDISQEEEEDEPWQWWNKLRTLCGNHERLNVVLEVTKDVPSEAAIKRWIGEPVACLSISTSIFVTNKKNYPVLNPPHQGLIRSFSRLSSKTLLTGHAKHPLSQYIKYMNYLMQTYVDPDPVMRHKKGFKESVTDPLQPLQFHIGSEHYQQFERDPIKYSLYQEAIYNILQQKITLDERFTKYLVVMVLGAGRGPLVTATMNAAFYSDRLVKVYAVEKSPYASITLIEANREQWNNSVTIYSGDMRDWQAPEKADIIVSELLGSFGDNELSPECLDGAQHILKDDGISIPSSYTSFLVPVQCFKIHRLISAWPYPGKQKGAEFEIPSVSLLGNKCDLAPVQPLFTFYHPNKDAVIDNSRYGILKFNIERQAVLHGFSGYFESVIHDGLLMSINPATFSKGMISWHPLFFPIKKPIHVRKGDVVELHFWRRVSKTDVWYEWAITSPEVSHIHNHGGHAHKMGLNY